MTVRVEATLLEITEWSEDSVMIDGDMSHEPKSAVLANLAEEHRRKNDDRDYVPDGIPFTAVVETDANADGEVDESDVRDRIMDAWREKHAKYDYLVPSGCEMVYHVKEDS